MKPKALIPILLALSLLFTLTAIPYSAAAEPYVLGDADGDNDVTIVDATAIQRLLAALIDDPEGLIALRGDADQDGELSILDATCIQRFLANYEVTAPIGETIWPTEGETTAETAEETVPASTQSATVSDDLPFIPA